jgi:SpoVK/Ycf46/Vps4 family AAA+-type ATPase
MFCEVDGRKFALTLEREYMGLVATVRCRKEHLDACLQALDDVRQGAAKYKFLRGEKFSLTGEFIEPTGDAFSDLYLDEENEKPLRLAAKLLGEKGASMPNRGVMLMGPPGTGKTLSGRVLMNCCPEATFIWVAAKDFYISGTFGGVSDALDMARELAPSIVFMEDVDNWLDGRGVDLLKSELDGLTRHRGVLTILTTNYPERMDKALIDRPGRFHDVLMFDLPSDDVRKRMLDSWMPAASDGQRIAVAEQTKGWSGAHLYELCSFAKTLQETESLEAGDALTKSVDKIVQQRTLIDAVQLRGSQYTPHRRELLDACAKAYAGGRSGLRTKAGRVLSQRNMESLSECLADLEELADVDGMPRKATALVDRCKKRLGDVIQSAKPMTEDGSRPDAKPKEGSKEIVGEYLAEASSADLKLVRNIVDARLQVEAQQQLADTYRALVG